MQSIACVLQSADQVKAAQQEAEAMKRETALAAAALEGRTQTLARQEAAAAESHAHLQTRIKELDSREVCYHVQPYLQAVYILDIHVDLHTPTCMRQPDIQTQESRHRC